MALLDLRTFNNMNAFPDFTIHSSLGNYTVSFSEITDINLWKPQADALLVDKYFSKKLSFPEELPIIWIDANEESKSLSATLEVFVSLKKIGLGRSSQLIAIGGGVVQDIATFVSSLYMRGITWSYIPTTLLGMTDSCLGGKSSINAGPFMNLIGYFLPQLLCFIIFMIYCDY